MKNIIVETSKFRRQFTVGVWPFDTIRQMKEAIERCQDFPVASQTLFFRGKLLVDKHSAESYGLFDDDASGAQRPVKLFVKPVPGLTLRLTVVSAVPDVGFSLRYDASEPLATLKKRIHELERVPADRLAFFLGTRELRDDGGVSLAGLGVTDHLEMRLVVKSMTVRIVGTSTEHFLSQDPTESVRRFRKKVRAALRVPADRRVLLFAAGNGGDRELREEEGDGATLLSDHGVTERSVVNVVVTKPPAAAGGADKVRVRIKITRLSSLTMLHYLDVDDVDLPAIRLKERIQKSEGVPAGWIALFIGDWELRDDWPLAYYGVVDDCSVVKWAARPVPGVAVPLRINVAGPGLPPLVFPEQDLIEPVGRLKERVGASLRVAAERLKVSRTWGRELRDDGVALGYCGVVDDPELRVVVMVRLTIQVSDAGADGANLDLLGDPTESVGELKKRIHQTLGILADVDRRSMSLFIGESELEDVRTLDSYGVTDGSVVKMHR